MKRLVVVLFLMAALIFVPLRHANVLRLNHASSDLSTPMPASVMTVAGTISGAGVAGRVLLGRRQK